MTDGSLQVLVVDDTIVYRKVLATVVESLPGFELAGTAANGRIALDKLGLKPVDLVLLDVEMPVMDGLQTLDAIRRDYPEVGVIMVSGVNASAANITVRALEHGAMDFIPKPDGADLEASRSQLTSQIRRVAQLFQTRRVLKGARRATGAPPKAPAATPPSTPAPPARPSTRRAGKIDVLAIGVSTGGPNALQQVIPRLPADLGVPVLIVQHMPPMFTASLAQSLNHKSALSVREAQEGDVVTANTVLIAPGGKHMVVRREADGRHVVALNENPPEQNCRPSVNVLFRSVSTYFGKNVLSVIMTGMGEDGCEGVRALKRQGAIVLTQSETTCVVYGMPRAVDTAGLSDAQIPLDELASQITRLVRNPAALP